MNEQDLERDVSRALHELFPEPTDVALQIPDERPRSHRRTAATVAAAAAVLAIGVTVALLETMLPGGPGHSARSGSPSSSTQTTPATPAASQTPAWAEKCLPQKAADRLGPAPEYVGLTRDAAVQLARQRGDTLKGVGAGGRCKKIDDLVFRSRVVAVVFDRLDANGTLPASARIVVAERVSGRWSRGWVIH